MYLYNLTLQPATHTVQAVIGAFSGSRQQEVVVGHGQSIELLRVNAAGERLTQLLEHNVFGVVRSLAAFRVTGATKDYLSTLR